MFVHSGRPLDGCKHHREGAQVYPKFAPPAHCGKSTLQGLCGMLDHHSLAGTHHTSVWWFEVRASNIQSWFGACYAHSMGRFAT